jgi:hypothetical protein
MEGRTNRRRRVLAALAVLLAVVSIGGWSNWRSRMFRDRAAALTVGMTEAEVVTIMGPPDAAWNAFPPYRLSAYGKGAGLRHSANNLWLDVTGRAQLHAGKAKWPVQVKFDENDTVVGIERNGETTGRSIRLQAVGVKSTRSAPSAR